MQAPKFDVVRVEPTGEAVIAGTTVPDALVSILDEGRTIAETRTDASGAFAILPTLPPGNHVLTLRTQTGAQSAVSEQSVTVSVPAKAAGSVVTALQAPDQPTRVLNQPAGPAAAGPVTIGGVEAGQEGAFYASGRAAAGSVVRIYLNGSFIADARSGTDGGWALRVEKGMSPGHYDVRADLLDGQGSVAGRAQVPFDYPDLAASAPTGAATTEASSGPAADQVPAGATSSAPQAGTVVVPNLTSVTVLRGDNLWRISRRVLGRGVRYTQIYEANSSQIRDPNRIWPGQILVAPAKAD